MDLRNTTRGFAKYTTLETIEISTINLLIKFDFLPYRNDLHSLSGCKYREDFKIAHYRGKCLHSVSKRISIWSTGILLPVYISSYSTIERLKKLCCFKTASNRSLNFNWQCLFKFNEINDNSFSYFEDMTSVRGRHVISGSQSNAIHWRDLNPQLFIIDKSFEGFKLAPL